VTHRLVFVNGAYDADLSQLPDLPQGVTIGNFKTLQDERILSYLTQQPGAEEVFTTLNTSCFEDLAVIWLDPNVVLSQPLHLLFISNCGQTPIFCQPRCLVVVQAHSSLSLIEDYATLGPGAPQGLGQRTYFNNGVTEFWLGENAQVHHSRIQREAQQAFHIGKTTVSQSRHSRYTNLAIHGGSRLSRHNLEVFHQGEGVETRLHGLALVTGQQLADTHSTICYSHPQGRSDQLYKAIADDRGRSVFNGRVVVPQAAQLTDAQQLNRNLLLSPRARVDTKPQLEIVADNVKCTHGATVSQLEDDEIFYLQSRGLDRTTAQNLLIDGFAAEIIQQLPVASLQSQLTQMVEQRTKT
jgi:Fe-S cluster assembly protein SufD